MTTATAEKQKPPMFVPKLNREGVADWSSGGMRALGFNDYGRFKLAFKKLRFETGKKDNMFYAGDCKVLECVPADPITFPTNLDDLEDPERFIKEVTPEKFQEIVAAIQKQAVEGSFKASWLDPTKKHPVGGVSTLIFPVGRTGTSTDPKKADRDDRYLVEFLRPLLGVGKGVTADFAGQLPLLAALPKREEDDIVLEYENTPYAKAHEILDPATKEVLRSTVRVFGFRRFSAIG